MAFNNTAGEDPRLSRPGQASDEKNLSEEKHLERIGQTPSENLSEEKHLEQVVTSEDNLVYDDVDEEPELHARTYIALASMFLLNLVQVVALQGPPAVVSDNGATRWT